MKEPLIELPVAETFHSLQGEGQWVGTPMFFLRLAGCNVGRSAKALKLSDFPLLPTGKEAAVCSSWDGRTFPCDTDYSVQERWSLEKIFDEVWERHICLTGGEPVLHQEHFPALRDCATDRGITLHLETSGTLMLNDSRRIWVTCSPKLTALVPMIKRSDELKLLVDEHFNPDRLTSEMLSHPNVFLCPINGVVEVNMENVQRCIDLTKKFPHWRVSTQMHKFLNLR